MDGSRFASSIVSSTSAITTTRRWSALVHMGIICVVVSGLDQVDGFQVGEYVQLGVG